jgi:phosphohistidine phosphatase
MDKLKHREKNMKLYLVRHGEALYADIDHQRILSAEGEEQVHALAKQLCRQSANPVHIYHSGLIRARQTAEILADYLHPKTIEEILEIKPMDPVDIILPKITTWTEDTMLVGHLPYLPNLVYQLSAYTTAVFYDTASAVCLEKTTQEWKVNMEISYE